MLRDASFDVKAAAGFPDYLGSPGRPAPAIRDDVVHGGDEGCPVSLRLKSLPCGALPGHNFRIVGRI